MPHRFGTNLPRETWNAIKTAIEIPAVYYCNSVTLTLKLGDRSLGWDMSGLRMERPGPALDLAGVEEVRLLARRLPQKPAKLEFDHYYYEHSYGQSLLHRMFTLFDIAGTITDLLDAEVKFALTPEHLCAVGRYWFEPLVKYGDGRRVTPRLMTVTIHPSLEC